MAAEQTQLSEDKFQLLTNGQHGNKVRLQDSKKLYGQKLGN